MTDDNAEFIKRVKDIDLLSEIIKGQGAARFRNVTGDADNRREVEAHLKLIALQYAADKIDSAQISANRTEITQKLHAAIDCIINISGKPAAGPLIQGIYPVISSIFKGTHKDASIKDIPLTPQEREELKALEFKRDVGDKPLSPKERLYIKILKRFFNSYKEETETLEKYARHCELEEAAKARKVPPKKHVQEKIKEFSALEEIIDEILKSKGIYFQKSVIEKY
jgi:hypothetical protein